MNLKMFFSFLIMVHFMTLYGQNAQSIIQKSMDAISFEGFEMTSTLYIYDQKGNSRQRTIQTSSQQSGDVTKTVSKFLAPPEVNGTSILIHDHEAKTADMWIYLPSTRKVRRIASSEKKGSFMGTEFSNGNMSKPELNDYTFKMSGTEIYEGKECFKIEVKGKSPEIAKQDGFTTQYSWVEKSSYLNQKTEYYDQKGKLLKTQTFRHYKKQPNAKYFCFLMEMKNEISGRRSVIETKSFTLGSAKKERAFTPASFME